MLSILFLVASVLATPTDLTQDNFDEFVFQSGKSAFIKFYAPWCGHCKGMKPAWDSLGSEYKDSKTVLIGDVDCTSDNSKSLCEKYNVNGYPTIKYFNPPDKLGKDYSKGRDLDALKEFAKNELGPTCSVDDPTKCSKLELRELKPYIDMDPYERDQELKDIQDKIHDAEEANKALLKQLQNQFKEDTDALEKLKTDYAPQIKKLIAATPSVSMTENTPKDEV